MSDEYRCKCHGLTVKEINDLFWEKEEQLAKGLKGGFPLFIAAMLFAMMAILPIIFVFKP